MEDETRSVKEKELIKHDNYRLNLECSLNSKVISVIITTVPLRLCQKILQISPTII